MKIQLLYYLKLAICLILFFNSKLGAQNICRNLVQSAIESKMNLSEDNLDIKFQITTWLANVDSAIHQTSSIQKFGSVTKFSTKDLMVIRNESLTLNFQEHERVLRYSEKSQLDISGLIPSVFALYDSLLTNARIEKCADVCDETQELKSIVFVPHDKYQNRYYISRIEFQLRGNDLINMQIDYKQGQMIQKIGLNILKWDKLNKPVSLTPQIAQVLKDPSSIRKQFADYQLVQY